MTTQATRNGWLAERWAAGFYAKAGWTVVHCSPSTPFDLLIFPPGPTTAAGSVRPIAVEVKGGRTARRVRNAKLTRAEEDELALVKAGARPWGWMLVKIVTYPDGTAHRLGVPSERSAPWEPRP